MWLWRSGYADQREVAAAAGVAVAAAERWTDDMDYMLRLSVRNRQFDWQAAVGDMARYVEATAHSGIDACPLKPSEVTTEVLRARWVQLDRESCDFFRRELADQAPPASVPEESTPSPPAPRGTKQPAPARPAAPAPTIELVAKAEAAVHGHEHVLVETKLPRVDGTAIGSSVEHVLDMLDVDGLLEQLEAKSELERTS